MMRLEFLRNPDGTFSVFGEDRQPRGDWSGVVAELVPVDGGVIVTQGASKIPIACRPSMRAAGEFVRRQFHA